MELADYLAVIRRGWWIIVLTIVVVVGVGLAFTIERSNPYTSTAAVVAIPNPVASDVDGYELPDMDQRRTATYASIGGGSVLKARVAKRLGLQKGERIGTIRSVADSASATIRITASNADAKIAQRVARIAAEELQAMIGEFESVPGSGDSLVDVHLIDEPKIPEESTIAPDVLRTSAFAGFVGLVLGMGIAVALELVRRALRESS